MKSWSDAAANNIYNLSWGKTETCDTAKWADANACNGVGYPWGYGTITQFVDVNTHGSVRAWHFFAERGQDRTRQWALEKNGALNVLFYEFIDKSGGTNPGAWTNGKSRYAWSVATAVYSGATTTILEGVALTTALLATLF